MSHFESRLLLAPHCPVCGWTREPPIGACRISTAHDARYASVQEERARPTYQRVLHPRANTGVRRSKVEGSKIFWLSLAGVLLQGCQPRSDRDGTVPPERGCGAEPRI